MKPPFKMTYDEAGDVLYISGSEDVAVRGIEHGGVLFRYAANGNLVGLTIIGPTDIRLERADMKPLSEAIKEARGSDEPPTGKVGFA